MTDTAFKVVIVGGGSSGWMTAAYLCKAFEKQINIQLIESEDINTIGVGEATFSDIHIFFDYLELKEEEWMPECNANYKLAIQFVNWNARQKDFYHPFQRLDMVHGHSMAEWWLKCKRGQTPFHRDCFVVPSICEAKKSPRFMDGRVFDTKVEDYFAADGTLRAASLDEKQVQHPYAYHFDAKLFAKFLSRYAQKRGVLRTVDNVENVEISGDGQIQAVRTKKNGRIEGNLFIDCTGFRGLLINQALKEPFVAFSESLLCDSAIAVQVPSNSARDGINPYTRATALSAGWTWNIPLFNRAGTGYVYSSAFLSSDAAEQEFRSHLNYFADESPALHIKMRIGRNRRSWVKNCIAIGLSSGFVEPLESTGIFFIQHAIDRLISHFPTKAFDQDNINSYNKAINDCIDGIRDFLILHYVASSREDTRFWKATKRDIKIPDDLMERLRFWKSYLPTKLSINPNYHGFEAYSYTVMLLGLGWEPKSNLPALNLMNEMRALEMFEKIRQRTTYLCSALPSNYEYLAARYARNNGNSL